MPHLRRAAALVLASALACQPPAQAAGYAATSRAPRPVSLPASPRLSLSAVVSVAQGRNPLHLPAPSIPASKPLAGAAIAPAPAARSPLSQLESAASLSAAPEGPSSPSNPAARQFDGSAEAPSAPTNAPVAAPQEQAPRADVSPRLGPWKRVGKVMGRAGQKVKGMHESTKTATRAGRFFERAFLGGLGLALAVPILLGSAPVHTLVVKGIVSLGLMVGFYGAITLFRIGRFFIAGPPRARTAGVKPGRLALALVAGLALGAGFGTTPSVYHSDIVQRIESVRAPSFKTQHVAGSDMSEETIAVMSANPVGRKVLDELRDLTGQVRLPSFYITTNEAYETGYIEHFDAVFISDLSIAVNGWTVAEFLADPQKQREYIRNSSPTIAHELKHAAQARRFPFQPAQFWNKKRAIEYEYEAYLTQHFFNHERLKADRNVSLGEDYEDYANAIDDLDAYLKKFDSRPVYQKNVHIDWPHYNRLIARVRADWPRHQLEAYALLAGHAQTTPTNFEIYRAKAETVAQKHGLPLPPIFTHPRP